MAIYRSSEFCRALVRDELDVPPISTPEQGEAALREAVEHLARYSGELVESHYALTANIRVRVARASEIALQALREQERMLETFRGVAAERTEHFAQLVDSCGALLSDLSAVDQLYDDVAELSELLTAVERFAAARSA